jgi:hypothetical protein
MKYSIKDFIPLIIIFIIIGTFTEIRHFMRGSMDLAAIMNDFMGAFFIIFGAFKIINWTGFVEAYQQYDLIAKHSIGYAYTYPLIELGLGIAYLSRWQPIVINSITLAIMLISSLGVFIELSKGKTITCACLGVVFKLPMTYVTLLEDLLMAGMAGYMIIKLLV